MNQVLKKSVTQAFDTLPKTGYKAYLAHFKAIQPGDDPEELFNRFLFSYLSVQTPWQSNVRLYNILKEYDWSEGPEPIKALFLEEGIGLQNTRPRFICDFAEKFKENPMSFYRGDDESWLEYRARLDKQLIGLSKAKISFTAEMIYPEESELVCLDRHMLKNVFRVKGGKYGVDCGYIKYKKYERMWNKESHARGMAPAIARLLYWDRLQGYRDSLFWTEVFTNG